MTVSYWSGIYIHPFPAAGIGVLRGRRSSGLGNGPLEFEVGSIAAEREKGALVWKERWRCFFFFFRLWVGREGRGGEGWGWDG